MKRVIILGSTGSIGVQALQVVAAGRELTVVGLSCCSRVGDLLSQATALGVNDVAVADEAAAAGVPASLYPEMRVRAGAGGAARLVREVDADLVLNAVVGFAGLEATVAALELGRPLALANKESLVSGGTFVTGLAAKAGVTILPVDSEHSALFQLLAGEDPAAVERLVLTASGGPFRGRTAAELRTVGPEDALAHPTWNMGAKITIDSATLMNKGLEVIEAHHLFGVPYERIEVVVHPQSLVHSLIHLIDGASLAHLGYPDMRVPISYALHYPERADVDVPQLDLAAAGSLTFEEPDPETFACLRLALAAGEAGGTAPCVLNAADEVAVAAFLDGRIPFTGIAAVIERVLAEMPTQPVTHFDDLFAADAEARRRSEDHVRGLTPA
jgi:1-deoxy-D-xylulose-5-phosphate reductoisomerase